MAGQGGTGGTSAGNGGSSGTGATAGGGGSSGVGGGIGTGGGTAGSSLLPDAGDPGPINLIANPDFEQGLSPWTMISQAGTIVRMTDCDGPADPDAGVSDAGEPERLHGLHCGRGTNRTAGYQGPAYPLNGVLTQGKTYTVSVYGRIANASDSVIKFTMRVICNGMPILYGNLALETPITDSEWLFLTSEFTVPNLAECPVMTDIRVYLEGPPGGVDILVDDLSIYEL